MISRITVKKIYKLLGRRGIQYPPPSYKKKISLIYPERKAEEVIEKKDERAVKIAALVMGLQVVTGLVLLITKGPGKEFITLQMLGAAVICIIPVRRKRELEELMQQRSSQLELSFCELTSKLSILMGAGLSVKSCWERIVMDYRRERKEGRIERNCLYEEMDLSLRLMSQGLSEGEAYFKFGERTGLAPYLRLVSLLERGRRNGSRDIAQALSLEAREAFELKLRGAREQGEKLGTRMLIPMMILFVLVLAIIIVPVLMSW